MAKNINVDTKSIGQRIREEREKLNLTREEFAEIIDLSDYYVGQLERGERQMSLPVLINVANCLHVSLDYLIFGKSPNNEYYVHDSVSNYSTLNSSKNAEINSLLERCSPKELDLIIKFIKVILPYLGIN